MLWTVKNTKIYVKFSQNWFNVCLKFQQTFKTDQFFLNFRKIFSILFHTFPLILSTFLYSPLVPTQDPEKGGWCLWGQSGVRVSINIFIYSYFYFFKIRKFSPKQSRLYIKSFVFYYSQKFPENFFNFFKVSLKFFLKFPWISPKIVFSLYIFKIC